MVVSAADDAEDEIDDEGVVEDEDAPKGSDEEGAGDDDDGEKKNVHADADTFMLFTKPKQLFAQVGCPIDRP